MVEKKRVLSNLAKEFQSGEEPFLILICGIQGTHKSSTAVKLGAMLNFASVVGTDQVRDLMQSYDDTPILQGKTTDRWQLFGEFSRQNLIKGLVGQSQLVKVGLSTILCGNLEVGENTIIEGVHLIPSLYSIFLSVNFPRVKKFHFLLVAENSEHHAQLLEKKFGRRHGLQKPWSQEKVRITEQIQNYLVRNARQYGAVVIPSTTPERNCRAIVKYLKANV